MKKPKIAIDFSSTGKGGGPYISNKRVIESNLKNQYDFIPFIYRTELGRFISIKRILDIKKQLEFINPDIVHFSGLGLMGFHISIACQLAGLRKTVMTVHGFSSDALNINKLKRSLLSLVLEPLTIFFTKKVYGVSEFVAKRKLLRYFHKKNFGCIYNIPPKYITSNDSFLREELCITDNSLIAVSVGRIIKDKGYHILDEAILKFRNNHGLKFIIVGEGDYLPTMKNKLKKQIENKQVYFLGYRQDVQQILKSCDFFILPTLHETLSIALLEASVEKLPLIASNTGGVPEIVKSKYNGILVEPGNVNELYQAILELYSNEHIRKEYGENAKLHVLKNFDQKSIEKKIDLIYKSLLSRV